MAETRTRRRPEEISPEKAWRHLAAQAGDRPVRSYPEPEKQLAAAVIHQAVREAKSSNGRAVAARRWLLSEEAHLMLDLVGLEHQRIEAFVAGLGPLK
jgi:hypothetical protein